MGINLDVMREIADEARKACYEQDVIEAGSGLAVLLHNCDRFMRLMIAELEARPDPPAPAAIVVSADECHAFESADDSVAWRKVNRWTSTFPRGRFHWHPAEKAAIEAKPAATDPDMPRRFRFPCPDASGGLRYGVYFPGRDYWTSGRGGGKFERPEMPGLEWIDEAPAGEGGD